MTETPEENKFRVPGDADVFAIRQIRDKMKEAERNPWTQEEIDEYKAEQALNVSLTGDPIMREVLKRLKNVEKEAKTVLQQAEEIQAETRIAATAKIATKLLDSMEDIHVAEWSDDIMKAETIGVSVLLGFPNGPVGEAYFDTVHDEKGAWYWVSNDVRVIVRDLTPINVRGAYWMPMPPAPKLPFVPQKAPEVPEVSHVTTTDGPARRIVVIDADADFVNELLKKNGIELPIETVVKVVAPKNDENDEDELPDDEDVVEFEGDTTTTLKKEISKDNNLIVSVADPKNNTNDENREQILRVCQILETAGLPIPSQYKEVYEKRDL